jgi:DNA-binding CsgD family transcriptional regulator
LTSPDNSPDDELIMAAVKAGAEVRTHPALPIWCAIVGRKTVIAPRDFDNPEMGLVLLRRGSHVRTALWMFARAWQTASPFRQEGNVLALNQWERQVLELLASGIKDEAAARRLGVSVRTYRRYVTDLCDRLGASSRFEAGMRAAQAGLVDQHDQAPAAAQVRASRPPPSRPPARPADEFA